MKTPKRDPIERCLLALLDTCLAWSEDTISERKLHASALLKQERERLGTDPEMSVATIHNHLRILAKLCRVAALFETEDKRQFSRLNTSMKDKLRQLRPSLVALIRRLEEDPILHALKIG